MVFREISRGLFNVLGRSTRWTTRRGSAQCRLVQLFLYFGDSRARSVLALSMLSSSLPTLPNIPHRYNFPIRLPRPYHYGRSQRSPITYSAILLKQSTENHPSHTTSQKWQFKSLTSLSSSSVDTTSPASPFKNPTPPWNLGYGANPLPWRFAQLDSSTGFLRGVATSAVYSIIHSCRWKYLRLRSSTVSMMLDW